MNITIRTIPPAEFRPGITGADWWYDDAGDLQVRVAPMSDWRREFVLIVHELVEAGLCKHDGVPHEAVDTFDIQYAKNHASGLDAGDDPAAPYTRQHCVATGVERVVAAHLSVPWRDYDREVEFL